MSGDLGTKQKADGICHKLLNRFHWNFALMAVHDSLFLSFVPFVTKYIQHSPSGEAYSSLEFFTT